MKSKLLVVALGVSALAGCRGQTSKDAPIFGIRNMFHQPRYEMQAGSDFFEDGRAMRPLVEGVVARETSPDPAVSRGRLADESGYVLTIPEGVLAAAGGAEKLTTRGRERYGIYCAGCHDATGAGNGLVKQRAVAAGAAAFVPPTFHQDRIRHMPDGQLYATIANGKGNMPAYVQVPVQDRWAIVSYVRALQVAQPKVASEATP